MVSNANLIRRAGLWTAVVAVLAGGWAAPLAGGLLPVLAAASALAAGSGAEAQARLAPRFGSPGARRLAGFWIGPTLATLSAVLISGRTAGDLGRLAPLAGAVLVGILLFAQDRELDERGDQRWVPLVFALVLYLVAFLLFVIYHAGLEQIYVSAAASGLTAALLAAALFRPVGAPPRRVWLFAGLTGLCVAEFSLALGAWITTGLLGGAFLLLFFYVVAGLLQIFLDGSLTPRLAIEYTVVGLIGLGLLFWTSPWRF